MNRKQFVSTLLVAVVSAFLGGTLGVWFLMPPSVLAQGEPQKVIEAQEFRVVDEDGKVLAILGSWEEAAFWDGKIPEADLNRLGVNNKLVRQGLRLFDENETIRASLALVSGQPQLDFFDLDGETRASLHLQTSISDVLDALRSEEPSQVGNDILLSLYGSGRKGGTTLTVGPSGDSVLLMGENDREEGRVYLVSDPSDGSAFFQITDERSGTAIIPLHQSDDELRSKEFILLDEDNIKAMLGVDEDGNPRFQLYDSNGDLRAVLGSTRLKNTTTGSTEIRAVSSLVLFDEEGNVVWSAP